MSSFDQILMLLYTNSITKICNYLLNPHNTKSIPNCLQDLLDAQLHDF